VSQRGYDGTTAQIHLAGATIEHTFSALDHTESQQHLAYDLTTAAGILAAVTAGVDPHGQASNPPLWNPTLTNVTSGQVYAQYKRFGRLLFVNAVFANGTATGTAAVGLSIPGAPVQGATMPVLLTQFCNGLVVNGSTLQAGNWSVAGGGSTILASVNTTSGQSLAGAGFNGFLFV